MLTSSNVCIFGQFLDLVGQHSPVKRPVTYIFSDKIFYWLSYPFYKTQKAVFVLEK